VWVHKVFLMLGPNSDLAYSVGRKY